MSSAAPQNPQGMVGTTVGNSYLLERVIGQGRHGALFEARHTRLSCRCAVRIIKTDSNRRSNLLGALSRQGGMTHPHLNPPRDVMVLPDEQLLIASPLLNGQDLNQRIAARGKLTAKEGVLMLRQAASALHAMHQQSLTHGNLTATNVFFVKYDDVSVENALSDGKSSQCVHVIDAGLGLLENNSATPAEDQRNLGRIMIAFVADLSPEQRQVLERTQDSRPESRFPNMADFWRAFDESAASRGQAAQARSVATTRVALVKGPAPRVISRRTYLIGAAAAASLVAVTGVAILGTRKSAPPPPAPAAAAATAPAAVPEAKPAESPPPPKAAPAAAAPAPGEEPSDEGSSDKRAAKKKKKKKGH